MQTEEVPRPSRGGGRGVLLGRAQPGQRPAGLKLTVGSGLGAVECKAGVRPERGLVHPGPGKPGGLDHQPQVPSLIGLEDWGLWRPSGQGGALVVFRGEGALVASGREGAGVRGPPRQCPHGWPRRWADCRSAFPSPWLGKPRPRVCSHVSLETVSHGQVPAHFTEPGTERARPHPGHTASGQPRAHTLQDFRPWVPGSGQPLPPPLGGFLSPHPRPGRGRGNRSRMHSPPRPNWVPQNLLSTWHSLRWWGTPASHPRSIYRERGCQALGKSRGH